MAKLGLVTEYCLPITKCYVAFFKYCNANIKGLLFHVQLTIPVMMLQIGWLYNK